MYDEKKDFEHHQKEVNDLFDIANHIGIEIHDHYRVLDFGAGQGMHVSFLQERFSHVTAVDIINYCNLYDGEYMKLLKEKHNRNGFELDLQRVSFIQTDGMDLLFKDELFNFSASFNVFEHIPNPRRGLLEMIRVTKPEGIIYLTFDPIWTADTGGHFYHRVPEPWGHLVLSEKEYTDKMKRNGAEEWEVSEFKNAMNKVRLDDHIRSIHQVVKVTNSRILYFDTWGGIDDEVNKTHPNYKKALQMGYTEKELFTRGIKCVIRKGR